ncbi:3-hydroxyisobutyrate dehydrogenase [Amorphus orientalis]|uniref:3-hydroxyisobutyrate dehydrogenase n=1 Tax=Amorphus orientalis TaxID=649198 RepID=A0AAE3VPX0_9HYPH|nr:3-hydroxyisobutyrate dehydrogenase [Amorphus orientalis]MDQ0316058.1 3-hydroxyisobutyrate dehydrogenase [Amorphus orientalis]
MAKIGFVGLGNMGGPMAANLVKAGHTVTGLDLDDGAKARLADAGGRAAGSLIELMGEAEIVITMLPAGSHVRSVYMGGEGVIALARPETLLIDCSTIDVQTSRTVAAEAEQAGLFMIDAPVSGGVGGAEAGTLTFMVGGPEPAFERAKPILDAMGKTVVHAGGPGNGQAAKICNNMVLGISMIAVSEAFNLADQLGLDRQALFDISSKASGQCWSLTTYCPVPGPVPTSPANRDYAPGFTGAMMLKDLNLAQDAARTTGTATPLGAGAQQIYTLLANEGLAARDFSAVIEFLRGNKSDEAGS